MLTLKEIMAGVDASLKAQWPDQPVYPTRRPKDFKRPSTLLEVGPITRKTMGGGQVKVTATVRLVVFLPTDDYGNSEEEELEETVDALLGFFEGGYIQVGGRCPHVLEATGDFGYDFATATAKLEFFDVSVSGRTGQVARELMQHVHTKFDKE